MNRGHWNNKLGIVDASLKAGKLKFAKKYSKEILAESDAEEMLDDDEIEYLKLVIALKRLKDDWISTLDKHVKRKRKNE
jgi:hypothetical protein